MNQRSHLGTTYLDTAKGAVETFMKVPTDRARAAIRARRPAGGRGGGEGSRGRRGGGVGDLTAGAAGLGDPPPPPRGRAGGRALRAGLGPGPGSGRCVGADLCVGGGVEGWPLRVRYCWGGGAAGPLGAPSHRNLASVLPSRPPCSFSRPPPALPQLRARDPASRGDRYMLVTFEEPPYAIKVTALALPLPFPVPSSLALPAPPIHPSLCSPPPPAVLQALRSFPLRAPTPSPAPERPGAARSRWATAVPSPARPGGGGGAAINMADISPPRRERQQ